MARYLANRNRISGTSGTSKQQGPRDDRRCMEDETLAHVLTEAVASVDSVFVKVRRDV